VSPGRRDVSCGVAQELALLAMERVQPGVGLGSILRLHSRSTKEKGLVNPGVAVSSGAVPLPNFVSASQNINDNMAKVGF
jgi:hypothetical protein